MLRSLSYSYNGVLLAVRDQGMLRPLVRRRHTFFPSHDLSQQEDNNINFNDDKLITIVKTTDRQAKIRPVLERKTQSFYSRPAAVIANHTSIRHAVHTDVMADDTMTSSSTPPPINGKHAAGLRTYNQKVGSSTLGRVAIKW